MDADGECFGELWPGAPRRTPTSRPRARNRLVEEIATFVQGQPQHDDITMVAVRIE
jgi:serine phosphatase RsbU (regulator of sigma subunit)